MDQAALELPDAPGPGPSAASTDDLLAQLAGEEIDRLLGDTDRPGDAGAGASAPAASASAVSAAASEAQAVDGAISSQLDNLFAQMAVSAAPPRAAGTASEAAATPAATLPTAQGEEPATTSAERAALDVSDLASQGASVVEDEQAAALESDQRPLPLLFRPLEWVNAPLAACPDNVRQLLGKIAILTLVNALSILAYLFFLRRHH